LHELSIMSQVIQSVLGEAGKRNAAYVKEITLEVGELTFLGTDQLEFGFEALKGEGPLRNAKLVIVERKAEIDCPCGYRGGVDYSRTPLFHQIFPVIECPECGGVPSITGGRDCIVRNIIMEIPDVQVQG